VPARTKRVLQGVGQRVFEARRAAHMTQEELGAKLHVDTRTVQRIERGENITLPIVIEIARLLVVPLPELFEPVEKRIARKPGRPALDTKPYAPSEPHRSVTTDQIDPYIDRMSRTKPRE
jgi:transcriptional regulator with XRE-family HTH domain